jgi:hypothetical protein
MKLINISPLKTNDLTLEGKYSQTLVSREEMPILEFASRLSSAIVDIDFDHFIVDVWPNGEAPFKSAIILWNCWVSFSGNRLSPRDLTDFRASPIELLLI